MHCLEAQHSQGSDASRHSPETRSVQDFPSCALACLHASGLPGPVSVLVGLDIHSSSGPHVAQGGPSRCNHEVAGRVCSRCAPLPCRSRPVCLEGMPRPCVQGRCLWLALLHTSMRSDVAPCAPRAAHNSRHGSRSRPIVRVSTWLKVLVWMSAPLTPASSWCPILVGACGHLPGHEPLHTAQALASGVLGLSTTSQRRPMHAPRATG